MRACRVVLSLLSVLVCSPVVSAQQMKSDKLPPEASLKSTPYIVLDSVITEQWPNLLDRVNAPAEMKLLNPGQCIRPALIATGNHADHFFDSAMWSWSVVSSGKETKFAAGPVAAKKLIKPEGMDFVNGALRHAKVKTDPLPVYTAMAMTADKWCVPADAKDATATIKVTAHIAGKDTVLQNRDVQVESLETGATKTFTDMGSVSEFMQGYHLAPEPARILPAFDFMVANQWNSLIPYYFIRAAIVHDKSTTKYFGPYIAKMPKLSEVLLLNLYTKAGVQLVDSPALTAEDKQAISQAADLPDAHDAKIDPMIYQKLDFMWAEFGATGQPKPVEDIVQRLAWRDDYKEFERIKNAKEKPTSLSDVLLRGLTYSAAGWSLNSFQQNDPLAADYMDAIYERASTPPVIKEELTHLATNPAFNKR